MSERERNRARWQPLAVKVPEITVAFWVVKVLTTGMGEAASDYLAATNLVLGAVVGVGGLLLALGLQFRARVYSPPTYWFAVSMVAVFGTIAADVLHKIVGLSYVVTSTFYAAAVAVLFVLWFRSEGTLSIHSITTTRRELFYWATVLASFALGTAVGDLTGLTLHLGFFASGLLFTVLIGLALVAWKLRGNAVAVFWTAYVLTRPLGASFADWIGKPHRIGGGLGFGDGRIALVLIALIAAAVGWLTLSGDDVQPSLPASSEGRNAEVPSPAS